MTPFFILLYITYFASSVSQGDIGMIENVPNCERRQANYNTTQILGNWFVVALIPDIGFPRMRRISCYKMDISETDEAGLRWLVRKKFQEPNQEFIDRIKGTIIRQRYHSEKPFDIWSKAVPGINGCFKQLISLETNNTRVADGEKLGTGMQLHIMEPDDNTGPYLVQVLWGRLISAVIYRRIEGISEERLYPIHEYVTSIRGYQRPPRICDLPTKIIDPPPFQRP